MTDRPKPPLVIAKDVQTFRPEDTPDEFLEAIRKELLQRAIDHLVGQGTSREDARRLAEQALSAPSHFPIPTLEGLERDGK